jgi:hypothetical protein
VSEDNIILCTVGLLGYTADSFGAVGQAKFLKS